MPYPNLLAAGVTNEGSFTPFELFAGESTIVTSQGVVGTTSVPQFVPVVRNTDGTISAWSDTYASMTGTFSGVGTANDTITLHGVVFTLVAAAATANQVTIGGTPAATAANFAAKADALSSSTLMHAAAVGAVITLTAVTAGTAGNSLAISEAGTGFSFTGAATYPCGRRCGGFRCRHRYLGASRGGRRAHSVLHGWIVQLSGDYLARFGHYVGTGPCSVRSHADLHRQDTRLIRSYDYSVNPEVTSATAVCSWATGRLSRETHNA